MLVPCELWLVRRRSSVDRLERWLFELDACMMDECAVPDDTDYVLNFNTSDFTLYWEHTCSLSLALYRAIMNL